MRALRDVLRLDGILTRADKARILVAYLLVGLGFIIITVVALWLLWPYNSVRFDGDTEWADGVTPTVEMATIADITFIVPTVENPNGYPLTFRRELVRHPTAWDAPYFVWPLGDPRLENPARVPFNTDDLPVRVQFPVAYNPGQYYIEITAIYHPNPLFTREITFVSPLFTIQ